MRIHVAQLLKGAIGVSRSYEIGERVDVSGDGVESPVQGEVNLMRTNRGILVKGTLHTGVEASCSRCLTLFSYPLTLNLEEEYFPTVNINTDAPLSLPEDDPGGFTIDEHHEIDLTEAVRQYTIIAIPMKPLCHEACAGLCPICGGNLNQAQCDCPTERIDPRWWALLEKGNQRKGKR